MLKKLKNYQILDLMEAFARIGKQGITSNKRFSYAVLMNDAELSKKVEVILSIATPSDNFKEYSEKRDDIVLKYAERGDDGNVIFSDDGNHVQISDDKMDTAKKELDELSTEYSDIIDERDKEIEEYNTILDLEVEVDLTMVDIDDVPDEVGQDLMFMKMLMPIIG